MEKFGGLLEGGSKLLWWRSPLVLFGKFEVVLDELESTHKNLMMWKYFGRMKD